MRCFATRMGMLAVVVAVAACGSSNAGSDGSGVGGAGGAGGTGGAGGAAPCGDRACTSAELCVHPSCGGAPPVCQPLPDGGECPTGWIMRSACNSGGVNGPGCEAPPCTPPAPRCITVPAACGGTPQCSCLPPDVCQGGGSCGAVGGGAVACLSG